MPFRELTGNYKVDDPSTHIGKAGTLLVDTVTHLVYVQNGTSPGDLVGGSSLTGFTSLLATDPPNDSVNESVLAASGGTTDQDIVLVPAGQGGLSLSVPTGDSNGGNNRGPFAIDLQIFAGGKNSPTQIASGSYSFAAGSGNTASGFHSHAIGWGNTASNWVSYAEGNGTLSSGFSSHAEGSGTAASGASSHAEGTNTTASGNNSHAEGTSTTASGEAAHAEGNSTTASGAYAHCEGTGGAASGAYSHAQNVSCTAAGQGSHAGGESAQATTDWAFAHGVNTIADGVVSFATGQDSHTRGVRYMQSYSTGGFFSIGDQQASRLCLKGHTTDGSTLIQLTSNGADPSTDNQLVVPSGASMAFTVTVLGRAPATGDSAMFSFTMLLRHDGGMISVSGLSVNASVVWADSGASSWTCVGTPDADNMALAVKVSGADATDVYWVAEVRSLELVLPVPPP